MTRGESLHSFLTHICRPRDAYRYTSLGSTYNTFRNPALLVQAPTPTMSSNGTAPPVNGSAPPMRHGLSTLTVVHASDALPSVHTLNVVADPDTMCGPGSSMHGSALPNISTLQVIAGDPSRVCIGRSPSPDPPRQGEQTTDNPSLSNGHGERYLPAYELKDGSFERAGRGSRPEPQAANGGA